MYVLEIFQRKKLGNRKPNCWRSEGANINIEVMKKQNVATICSNLCEHTIHAPLNWAWLKDGKLFCVLQDTKMNDVERNTHTQEEGAGDDKA